MWEALQASQWGLKQSPQAEKQYVDFNAYFSDLKCTVNDSSKAINQL